MTVATQPAPGQQRSIETRNKLIAATYDCIHDFGYHGTSTTKVIDRAKMSRGAMLHHFPTKIDLIAAAYEAIPHRH